jgi:hypothetical protein
MGTAASSTVASRLWSASTTRRPNIRSSTTRAIPDAKNGPDRFAGANYALIAPSKAVCHPAGQWNSTRILARGAHVEHWLNGEKVVDYELWTPAWKALVANSKFKQWPSYGLAKSGHIGLQDHGNAVAFKNIKIRVLK